MFDIGFTEILVIATISLLVIGPERLPETVRTISVWIGRFKRSMRETRREIEQQIGADEIRRELHNEEVMRSLEKIRRETQSLTEDIDRDPKAGSQQERPASSSSSENPPPPEAATPGENNADTQAPGEATEHEPRSEDAESSPRQSKP